MRRPKFAELLDALERAGPGGEQPPAAATPARHRRAFVVESTANRAETDYPEPGRLAGLYLNEPLLAAGDVDARLALQAWVADALQLHPGMTAAELNRLRRTFALAHHPDRAGAFDRDEADRRMMIANMLIDQALAGKAS
ncbi:MAG TPA: hypothetical protein VFR19_02720 [Hyphomicrobiaceae bacterium]|jgi:hypothetical protein|nr:hypothetical protein [Hyphomicrobiaceae bacterium]